MTAVAHKAEPYRANSVRLLNGDGDNRRQQINPQYITPVHTIETNDTGESVEVPAGDLPLGTRELYVQHRMCGDFYCFIHGTRQVSALGDTPKDAFTNALRQAA